MMTIEIYRNGECVGTTSHYKNCKEALQKLSKKAFLVVGNKTTTRIVNLIGQKITVKRKEKNEMSKM